MVSPIKEPWRTLLIDDVNILLLAQHAQDRIQCKSHGRTTSVYIHRSDTRGPSIYTLCSRISGVQGQVARQNNQVRLNLF